jgi:hypothetical protein
MAIPHQGVAIFLLERQVSGDLSIGIGTIYPKLIRDDPKVENRSQ